MDIVSTANQAKRHTVGEVKRRVRTFEKSLENDQANPRDSVAIGLGISPGADVGKALAKVARFKADLDKHSQGWASDRMTTTEFNSHLQAEARNRGNGVDGMQHLVNFASGVGTGAALAGAYALGTHLFLGAMEPLGATILGLTAPAIMWGGPLIRESVGDHRKAKIKGFQHQFRQVADAMKK